MKNLILTATILLGWSVCMGQVSQATSNKINLASLIKIKEVPKPVAATPMPAVAAPVSTGKLGAILNSDVDVNIPVNAVKNPNGFALIIGNANYEHTSTVDYAINDARAVEKYVLETLGYPRENVVVIEDASQKDFSLWFGNDRIYKGKLYNWLFANDETISDLFVYYAGHGAPDPNTKSGYFLPVDCDPNYIDQTSFSGEVLFKNIGLIGARSTTIVLDACFSGAGIITGLSAVAIKPKDFGSIPNGVIISSSSGTEPSAWYIEKNHGLFTYFFLKSLQTPETDINKDGVLSAQEVYDWTQNKVVRNARGLRNLDQHPTLQGENTENHVVVDLSNGIKE